MKKILFYTILPALLLLSSCELFKLDNYDAPSATLKGEIVDVATGERVLTDQGSEGIIVRLWEESFPGKDNGKYDHNPDFSCMPDGTFQNTKLFEGKYRVEIYGPFIPLKREDANGILVAPSEFQVVDVKGTTSMKYEVQPFLKVEWVGYPAVASGRITAKVRVTRAVTPEVFREKIQPMGSYSTAELNNFLNVTDVQFFVSYSSSVGYRARDERWSTEIKYSGSAFNTLLGQPVTLTSKDAIPSGRKVFIRAAARINYATLNVPRYNYSEVIEVDMP